MINPGAIETDGLTRTGAARTLIAMSIVYLDGIRLRRGIIAGSKALFEHTKVLNEINVFPVADGDTGTNMASTVSAMIEALRDMKERSIAAVVRTAADSAILGAKGNSGTILAQYFHGLAEGLSGRIHVTTRAFGEAVHRAVGYAYRSIHTPKEGTLLSVLRDWSQSIYERCAGVDDFAELFRGSLEAARTSLERTREQLEVLRKAGVVDAGAMGFVRLVEGVFYYMMKGRIEEGETVSLPTGGSSSLAVAEGSLEAPDFRYCAECVVEQLAVGTDRLADRLEEFGDSVIVAGSQRLAKVHVHTDSPGELFTWLDSVATVSGQKVDDMKRQFAVARSDRASCVLVVDSTCDLADSILDELDINVVPIQVLIDEKVYLDRVALKSDDFYRLLAEHPETSPTTSQPRAEDFRRMYEFLLEHADEVVVLTISSKLSGTLNAAHSALGLVNAAERITIIDSGTLSVAFGLIARRVAEALRSGASATEATALAADLRSRTEVYVTVPSLDQLVRSGRVSRTKGIVARLLNLKPILTVEADGTVGKGGSVFGVSAGKKKLLEAFRKSANRSCDVAIGHTNAPEEVAWLLERLGEFGLAREPIVTSVSPALATHVGMGAVALAFIRPE
jgi:uncharacterized protein